MIIRDVVLAMVVNGNDEDDRADHPRRERGGWSELGAEFSRE
jgi:hypothetical protein